MKKLCLILALIVLLFTGCAAPEAQEQPAAPGETEAQEQRYELGEKMEDFTVTTADGESITLSEILKEKDMVLINLWATWCGPCCEEFPVMEEVYLQYQDRVEIIALSTEPTDSLEVIKEFAQSLDLSFVFAQDTPDFLNKFGFEAIPSSLVVDRFGTVCYAGYIVPKADYFERLFDAFVGEDYVESTPLTAVPPQKPNIEPVPEEDLTAALGAPAFNPVDAYSWPMLVSEKDGRSVVYASNTGISDSQACVTVKLDAKVGDAIAVSFKISSEAAADLLSIQVNGSHVKYFGGEHDWSCYAIPVEADGSYEITLSFSKDSNADTGEDCAWIDSVSLLSGQEAADALAANPVYPTGDAVRLQPTGCQSRKLVFPDDAATLDYLFGTAEYYIVDRDSVTIHATLPDDIDPEGAFFSHMFEGSFFGLTQCMTEDGYDLEREVACFPDSVIPFTAVLMGLDPAGAETHTILVFRDEANVEEFVRVFALGNWFYADELGDMEQDETGLCSYTIRCEDQNGDPVEGVMVQICDASSCRVVQTDAQGMYVLSSEPCAWEIHVLSAPEGYTVSGEDTVTTSPAGDEIILILDKN